MRLFVAVVLEGYVENLQVMTCGHIGAEARRTDELGGNTIHSMLADYQSRAESGSDGREPSPANAELTVRTYSRSLDRLATDANGELTLRVDLAGAGGPFCELARVDPAGRRADATFDGLTPGRVHEWYATIDDCAHVVRTPVSSFTTSP